MINSGAVPASRPRTLLGFDFGHARIGVAVGQELTATAQPLAILDAVNQRPNWSGIDQVIEQWRPELLVVGVPYHADGSKSTVTTSAIRFSRQLRARYSVSVETIDERLSSREAHTFVATKRTRKIRGTVNRVDAVAAALILESWLHRYAASST